MFFSSLLVLASLVLGSDFEVTEEVLAEVTADAKRAFDEHFGIEDVKDVPVVIASRKEIAETLRSETFPQFINQGIEEEEARDQAETFSDMMSRFLLGKYAFVEGKVMIPAKNFQNLADLIEDPKVASLECLRAVVVHELVHALDARRYKFPERLMEMTSRAAIESYNAVVEGHAQFLARKICEKSGWSEGFETLTRSIGTVPPEEDEATRLMMKLEVASAALAYYDGEDFITALVKARPHNDGADVLKLVFEKPPSNLDLIFHPDWYLDPSTRPVHDVDLNPPLEAIVEEYGEGLTTQTVSAVRPQLEAALSQLPKQDVTKLLDSMSENRMLVMVSPSGTQYTFAIYRFVDATSASSYVVQAVRLNKLKDELMKEGRMRVEKANYRDVEEDEFRGTMISKAIKVGDVGLQAESLVASKGLFAIEFLVMQGEMGEKEFREIATKVFAALFEEKDPEGDD